MGFYNRDGKCLLLGTDWSLIYSRLRFVFKMLTGINSELLTIYMTRNQLTCFLLVLTIIYLNIIPFWNNNFNIMMYLTKVNDRPRPEVIFLFLCTLNTTWWWSIEWAETCRWSIVSGFLHSYQFCFSEHEQFCLIYFIYSDLKSASPACRVSVLDTDSK